MKPTVEFRCSICGNIDERTRPTLAEPWSFWNLIEAPFELWALLQYQEHTDAELILCHHCTRAVMHVFDKRRFNPSGHWTEMFEEFAKHERPA